MALNFQLAALPANLLNLPVGSWGISYDLSTTLTRDDPPDGWGAWPGTSYNILIRQLRVLGFHHHQDSDYRADNIHGVNAWFSGISLKLVLPPMKLETTMKNLKVHYYPNLHLLDLTPFMTLGGPLSPRLGGPIPASLLPGGLGVVGMNGGAPAPPGPNFRIPKHSRSTVHSTNRNNWRS